MPCQQTKHTITLNTPLRITALGKSAGQLKIRAPRPPAPLYYQYRARTQADKTRDRRAALVGIEEYFHFLPEASCRNCECESHSLYSNNTPTFLQCVRYRPGCYVQRVCPSVVIMTGYAALNAPKPAAICGFDVIDNKQCKPPPFQPPPQKNNSKTCDEIRLVPLPLVDRPVHDDSGP